MSARSKTSRPRRPATPVNPTKPGEAETPELAEEPTEVRFPIDGHAAGEHAFYAARRKGDQWAVIDNRAGHAFGPDFFDGRMWGPLTEKYQHLAYRWTREEAEELAKHYASVASEVHQHYAGMVDPEFADWLAGKAEHYVKAVREAVAS